MISLYDITVNIHRLFFYHMLGLTPLDAPRYLARIPFRENGQTLLSADSCFDDGIAIDEFSRKYHTQFWPSFFFCIFHRDLQNTSQLHDKRQLEPLGQGKDFAVSIRL